MDFDDLLVLWLRLLQDHPEVREQYQRRFQFVLVDEYQDTNGLQSDLIDLLGARHQNVMVVGDDAQSIYAWRGANFQNILEFPKRYPEANVYKIETNYRSTPEILNVANAAIGANLHQFSPRTFARAQSGCAAGPGRLQRRGSAGGFVAQRVLELREEGVELDEWRYYIGLISTLWSSSSSSRRHNIPFTITSGIRFFEQAHIKDVSAYLSS